MPDPTDPPVSPPASIDASPSPDASSGGGSNFRRFFLRGLAIVLPTVLTIAVLLWAANFVDKNIAAPINTGIRELVIRFTQYPPADEADFLEAFDAIDAKQRDEFAVFNEQRLEALNLAQALRVPTSIERQIRLDWMQSRADTIRLARRSAFEQRWNQYAVGGWPVLNLIGLLLAIVLVYIVGAFISRSIGNRLWKIGEDAIGRVPLVGRVYPAFKQITDFIFGDDSEDKLKFNRVVAVQYPRKGLWSVGLVTGNTMRTIQDQTGVHCLTVFVPSSPTPFTGYVITVPVADTVDLPVSIEDALKFAVSGGVVVPPKQVIPDRAPESPRGLPHTTPVVSPDDPTQRQSA
ncbi:MAG: DUF502 domain-containing protein [Planctomycetota bacterium]